MMMIKGISALLLFAGQVLPAWCLTIDQVGVFSYLNSLLLVAGFLFWLWRLRSDYTVAIGVVAAGILAVRALAVLSAAITKGTDRVLASELVYSLGRPLVFAVLCAIAYLTFERVSLEYVLVFFAASFLFAAVICYVINLPIVIEAKKLCGVSSVTRLYRGTFFAMIPHYGIMGAVIASVFANILLNVALALMIYKRIGLNVTMLNLIK